MTRRRLLKIPGPILAGKPRLAAINVWHHPTTSTVKWDLGPTRHCAPASDAFQRRLEAAGMREAICRWWQQHHATFCHRAILEPGGRRGHARHVPPAAADNLAELVAGFYREAILDLSLVCERPPLPRSADLCRHYSPSHSE